MKYQLIAALLLLMLLLSACTQVDPPTEPTQPSAPQPSETESTPTEPTETDPTEAETTAPTETKPEHSELYIPGLSVEDVILYFNEVCLDSEFVNSGDPSVVQKWVEPIYYKIEGEPTAEDWAVLGAFEAWLNSIPGFPGISSTEEASQCNLRIYFCSKDFLIMMMGSQFEGTDGAVTFWYNALNEITSATICYRTDLDQHLRNSVILEEIYNGLGPIQDTALRPDSIIYQEFSQPQALTEIDELILKLLYHPDMQTGINAQECERIIRELYY